MTTKPLSKYEQMRASNGFVKNYYVENPSTSIGYAPNPTRDKLDDFLNLYKSDPIVAGAIDTVSEEAVKNKGYFTGSKTAVEKARKLFDKLDFYGVAEAHVKAQHIYGDSFIEIIHNDKGELELHPLETTEIFIEYDKHGEIKRYVQYAWDIAPTNDLNLGEMVAQWSPEEVCFLPLKKLGSKKRSYFPLEPAISSITAKAYGSLFLETTFKNFKPQTIYVMENNASPQQVDAVVTGINACDKDPSKKLLSVGNLEVKNTGMYDFKKDIVDILNYLRQDILTTTKVPGIYVGITADSNRGVGEFEANAFQSHLLKLHRDIEKLARVVLEKANIKADFRMKPPSVKSQSDIIEHASKLRSMGYGEDTITPYLFENGIDIPMDAKFEVEEKFDPDNAPSRQKSDKSITDTSNLNEQGRSEEGKAKMEEQATKVRSIISKPFKEWFSK
jgi:hypothetical protein